MIGKLPEPCPTLRAGLAIGAKEHNGFVNVWNWIVDVFRNIKDKLVTGINGRTGDISIVAGKGIEVVVDAKTITIGIGEGKSKDKDNPDNTSQNGSTDGSPSTWQDKEPSEVTGIVPDDCLSGGSGGGGGMFKWDNDTRTIGVGGAMVGRQFYPATSGTGSNKTDNTYQLKVTLSQNGSVTCAVVAESSIGKAPTTTECWIPIYKITDGKIDIDYRGAFVVPAYD
jgi:hypothetical protein